jgi:hypothetical protein
VAVQVWEYHVDRQTADVRLTLHGGDQIVTAAADLSRVVTARPALGRVTPGPPRVTGLVAWDVVRGKQLVNSPPAWDGSYLDVALSGNGRGLACLTANRTGQHTLTVFDPASGKVQVPTFAAAAGQFVRYTPSGDGVYTYDPGKAQVVWYDLGQKAPNLFPVRCPDWAVPSPDNKLVLHAGGTASGFAARNAAVFEAVPPPPDRKAAYAGPEADREVFEDAARSAYWTPDGTRVVALPKRGNPDLRVYDAASGELLLRYPDWFTDAYPAGRRRAEFERISFLTADGTRILSADAASLTLQVWTIKPEGK